MRPGLPSRIQSSCCTDRTERLGSAFDDADAGKDARSTQIVNQQITGGDTAGLKGGRYFWHLRCSGCERCRRKRLVHRAKSFFANEAENLGNAQVRLYDLSVAQGNYLAARIQTLRKTCNLRVRVWSGCRIMLIVIFGGKRMGRIGIPIQIRDGLMGQE